MKTFTGELDETKIVDYPLDNTNYFQEIHQKTQLILHHSAGWDNARGMIDSWKSDKARVATAFGMIDDGTLFRAFDPKYWASHVGYFIKVNDKVIGGNERAYSLCPGTDNRLTNYAIETRTIGIEVCNWGSLVMKNGKFLAWPSKSLNAAFKTDVEVHPSKVVHYPTRFRGFEYFEKYTEQEIESLWKFIRHICSKFQIPCKFNVNQFDINPYAIRGVPGVYTHTNFRADKVDLHPQPELIEMLKAL